MPQASVTLTDSVRPPLARGGWSRVCVTCKQRRACVTQPESGKATQKTGESCPCRPEAEPPAGGSSQTQAMRKAAQPGHSVPAWRSKEGDKAPITKPQVSYLENADSPHHSAELPEDQCWSRQTELLTHQPVLPTSLFECTACPPVKSEVRYSSYQHLCSYRWTCDPGQAYPGFVKSFWETLFPKREKGKTAPQPFPSCFWMLSGENMMSGAVAASLQS